MYDKPKDQNLPCNLQCKHKPKKYKLFKIMFFLQAYAIFFPFFLIIKEFHYLRKAMGGGSTSP